MGGLPTGSQAKFVLAGPFLFTSLYVRLRSHFLALNGYDVSYSSYLGSAIIHRDAANNDTAVMLIARLAFRVCLWQFELWSTSKLADKRRKYRAVGATVDPQLE